MGDQVIPNVTGTNEFNDPLYLHPSDNAIVTIINFKLTGTENYRIWSASMCRALKARNKIGFVDGSCVRPSNDEAKAKQWDRADAVVLNWILGTVSEDLYLTQAYSKSSASTWLELKETFEKTDGSIVFNLYQKINSLTQNGLSVSDYYNKLSSLWKDFDTLTNIETCTCEASQHAKLHSQHLKLMQFLMGLDDGYSQVRSNLLLRDPLPDVKVAFSIISREESHKGSRTTSNKGNNSAFVSKVSDNKKGQFRNLVCKHCGIKGHTIERCYKLIGFPKNFNTRNENQTEVNKLTTANCNNVNNLPTVSNNTSSKCISSPAESIPCLPFSNDQIAKILSLIGDKHTPDEITANMAGFNIPVDCGDW